VCAVIVPDKSQIQKKPPKKEKKKGFFVARVVLSARSVHDACTVSTREDTHEHERRAYATVRDLDRPRTARTGSWSSPHGLAWYSTAVQK
jgi:hypothetical protein